MGLEALDPLEVVPPVGVELDGQDRRVVGPVLEEPPLAFDQPDEMRLLVARVTGKQDVVLAALDGRHGIDLHEAQPAGHAVDPAFSRRAGRVVKPVSRERRRQAVEAQQRAADLPVGYAGQTRSAHGRRPPLSALYELPASSRAPSSIWLIRASVEIGAESE